MTSVALLARANGNAQPTTQARKVRAPTHRWHVLLVATAAALLGLVGFEIYQEASDWPRQPVVAGGLLVVVNAPDVAMDVHLSLHERHPTPANSGRLSLSLEASGGDSALPAEFQWAVIGSGNSEILEARVSGGFGPVVSFTSDEETPPGEGGNGESTPQPTAQVVSGHLRHPGVRSDRRMRNDSDGVAVPCGSSGFSQIRCTNHLNGYRLRSATAVSGGLLGIDGEPFQSADGRQARVHIDARVRGSFVDEAGGRLIGSLPYVGTIDAASWGLGPDTGRPDTGWGGVEVAGLEGEWFPPAHIEVSIGAAPLRAFERFERSVPSVAVDDLLFWSTERGSFRGGFFEISDLSKQARHQNLLFLAGLVIGLAAAAGLLAMELVMASIRRGERIEAR